MPRVIQNIIFSITLLGFIPSIFILNTFLLLQTTLQALERSQRENNVLSERLGAVSCPFL